MKSYLKTWTNKRKQESLSIIIFVIMALSCFNIFREFFIQMVKIVPVNISELLTNIILAHQIMDDESKQGKGIYLNMYTFSEEDIKDLLIYYPINLD